MAADRAASGVGRMTLEPASSAGSQGSGAGSGTGGGGIVGTWRTAFRAASDAVVGLPPREVRQCSAETTLPLLRLSMVLLRLSELIYSVDDKYLDSTVGVELPIAGRHGDRASVVAKLVHFRGAVNSDGLSSPEQFGVWEVDGVGLCVAFRGTASTEDVLIDVNITPTPLETSRNMRGVGPIEVHQGFHQGAKRQLPEIQSVVAAHGKDGGKRLPVWITGHSLGGGYANAVMLHMLANRTCAELFGAGGGSVTFGAPMVVYATDPVKLYDNLQRLEAYAEQQAGEAHPPLQFHNFVNGADIVPRLLGASLDRVHSTIGSYFQILQYFTAGVQKVSKYYHPFGTYHFILGAEIRTPPGSATARSCSGGGRIGDAAYAELIAEQLALDNVLKHYMRGAANGPAVDHFLASYETGLRTLFMLTECAAETLEDSQGHMEAVAAEQATAESDRDTGALFVLPAAGTAAERTFTHSVGATVGSASWRFASAAAAVAGKAALARIASGNAASSTGAAAGATGGSAAAGGTWGSYLTGLGSSAVRAAATAAQGSTGEDSGAAVSARRSGSSGQRGAGGSARQEL